MVLNLVVINAPVNVAHDDYQLLIYTELTAESDMFSSFKFLQLSTNLGGNFMG